MMMYFHAFLTQKEDVQIRCLLKTIHVRHFSEYVIKLQVIIQTEHKIKKNTKQNRAQSTSMTRKFR